MYDVFRIISIFAYSSTTQTINDAPGISSLSKRSSDYTSSRCSVQIKSFSWFFSNTFALTFLIDEMSRSLRTVPRQICRRYESLYPAIKSANTNIGAVCLRPMFIISGRYIAAVTVCATTWRRQLFPKVTGQCGDVVWTLTNWFTWRNSNFGSRNDPFQYWASADRIFFNLQIDFFERASERIRER